MNECNPKELCAREAHVKILDIIDYFIKCNRETPNCKFYAEINDVKFYDIFVLYKRIQGEVKMLYLPHELDSDFITLVFMPAPNCTIQIESVPAHTYKANKLKINLN